MKSVLLRPHGPNDGWLRQHQGRRIRLRLADGYELCGVLTEFSRTELHLCADDGSPAVVVSRHAIALAQAAGGVAPAALARVAVAGAGDADPLPRLIATLTRTARRYPATAAFVATFIVYWLSYQGRNQVYNQFVLLADAFAHGRLHVIVNAPWLELAKWEGRQYVAYPPMPGVLLTPFVALFGPTFPQPLFSVVLGAINAALCYLALWHLFKNRTVAAWSTALFAFGTVQWYAAENGSVWTVEHVVALFFLWLAILEAATRRRLPLIGLALGCAYLSRLPTVLSVPFFVIYLWQDFLPRRRPIGTFDFRHLPRTYTDFAAGIMLAIALNAAYNYARFGTTGQAGYTLIGNFEGLWTFRYGLLDRHYMPGHLREMLLRGPAFRSSWPFVIPDIYAMSIWVTTPAFVIAIFANWRSRIALGSALAVVLIAIPILMHHASGFSQFGYRYTLDFTPFLILLCASAMRAGVTWWMKALIVLSILVNLWGVLMLSFFEISVFG